MITMSRDNKCSSLIPSDCLSVRLSACASDNLSKNGDILKKLSIRISLRKTKHEFVDNRTTARPTKRH